MSETNSSSSIHWASSQGCAACTREPCVPPSTTLPGGCEEPPSKGNINSRRRLSQEGELGFQSRFVWLQSTKFCSSVMLTNLLLPLLKTPAHRLCQRQFRQTHGSRPPARLMYTGLPVSLWAAVGSPSGQARQIGGGLRGAPCLWRFLGEDRKNMTRCRPTSACKPVFCGDAQNLIEGGRGEGNIYIAWKTLMHFFLNFTF